MTTRIKVELVRKHGMFHIICRDMAGYQWVLNHRFSLDSPQLYATLEKIRAAGTIDPTQWRRPSKSGW